MLLRGVAFTYQALVETHGQAFLAVIPHAVRSSYHAYVDRASGVISQPTTHTNQRHFLQTIKA